MTVRALKNAREFTVPLEDAQPSLPIAQEELRPHDRKMRETTGAEPLLSTAPVELDASAIRTKSDLMKLFSSILDARQKGRRVALVFDIDNTLMDTRHRTAAAARSFQFRG